MADVTEGPGSDAVGPLQRVLARIAKIFEGCRPSGDIQRFKEDCEEYLGDSRDVAALTDEERDAVSARVAELAAAFDPIDSERFKLAQQICRETAKALRASPKVGRILATWPAPIANELAAMLLRLEKRGSVPPSPEGAMVQLRDLSEVLLRLPVVALGRMMIARGGDGARHARRALLEASAGNWAKSARTIAGKVREEGEGVPEPYRRLATIMDDPKHPFHKSVMDGLITARNAYIGHGATQSDPVETASLIRWFIDPEAPKPQDKYLVDMRGAPLISALVAAVNDRMWDGLALSVLLPDGSHQPLRGAMALDAWAVQPHRHDPEGPVLKVLLACGSHVVSLEPFLSARRCGRCGKNDFFLFDSMRSWEQVALIDYARGHPDRLKVKGSDFAPDVEALRNWVDDVILEDADGLDSEKIFARLESLGIERRYRRPTFLRKQLRAFLKEHSRGVVWLRAPAHVGKSTFVLGLTNASVDKEHLTEKEFVPGPGNGNRIASFICRREYKSSPVNFLNALKAALIDALDIPKASSDSLPEVSDVLRQSDNPRAAFVAFVEALRRIARPGRLLIVIDGLDEAQPGDNRLGIPDLVPAAADLPEGVYVLLTSRRPGDPDCPPRLVEALRPVFGEALDPASCPDGTRIIEIDMESTNGPYRQLLREFVCANIAGDPASTERLADRIIEISDGRFHNVTFLTAQLAGGRIARDTLERGDDGGLRPDSIHADFLDNLDNRYGPKIADRMRRVLAALCAAEAAQDWHFTEGAEPDLATVGAEDLNAWLASVLAGENPPPPPGAAILEPFGREWHGIPVEILAEAAHMDRAPDRHGRRYGAILLETLALLQGTLDVWRGDERDALWRIGLKELRPVLEEREDFRGPLADAHALFAGAAFEATEAYLEASDQATFERWVARAPRLEGHVALSGAETAAHRFAQPDVREAIGRVAGVADRSHRLSARIAWNSLAARWVRRHRNFHADVRRWLNDLAAAYMNRGVAKQGAEGHGLRAAIADYDEAIRIREALRDALGEAEWTAAYRDDLASAYMNRGNAKQHAEGHGLRAAIADYDEAIRIREALRDALGDAEWTAAYRHDLASAYMNRGNAKQGAEGHGLRAAIADYDEAIRIREALRDALGDAEWTAEYRNALALAHLNRARAGLAIDPRDPRVCADLAAAIEIWVAIRARPERADERNAWLLAHAVSLARDSGCPPDGRDVSQEPPPILRFAIDAAADALKRAELHLTGYTTLELAFAPGWTIVQLFGEGSGGRVRVDVVVHEATERGGLCDGSVRPLMDLIRMGEARLDDASAVAYAVAACAITRAEAGSFDVLEVFPEELRPRLDAGQITRIAADVPPRLTGRDREGRWRIEAIVSYGPGLFASDLAVHPDGRVEMLSDDPIVGYGEAREPGR